jgi:hypothetical protein
LRAAALTASVYAKMKAAKAKEHLLV